MAATRINKWFETKFWSHGGEQALARFQFLFSAALIAQLLYDKNGVFEQVKWMPRFHPLPILDILGIGRPTIAVFSVAFWLLIAALAGLAWGKYARACSASALILSVFVFASLLSFTKSPDSNNVAHSRNLVIYVLFILTIAPRGNNSRLWSLSLIRFSVAWIYTSSAYAKLMVGGLGWMNGQTLQAYLYEHALLLDRPQTWWLAGQKELCLVLSVALIFFELTFVFAALTARLAILYAVAAVTMHFLALHFMGIRFLEYHLLAFLIFLVGGYASRKAPEAC